MMKTNKMASMLGICAVFAFGILPAGMVMADQTGNGGPNAGNSNQPKIEVKVGKVTKKKDPDTSKGQQAGGKKDQQPSQSSK